VLTQIALNIIKSKCVQCKATKTVK